MSGCFQISYSSVNIAHIVFMECLNGSIQLHMTNDAKFNITGPSNSLANLYNYINANMRGKDVKEPLIEGLKISYTN